MALAGGGTALDGGVHRPAHRAREAAGLPVRERGPECGKHSGFRALTARHLDSDCALGTVPGRAAGPPRLAQNLAGPRVYADCRGQLCRECVSVDY